MKKKPNNEQAEAKKLVLKQNSYLFLKNINFVSLDLYSTQIALFPS